MKQSIESIIKIVMIDAAMELIGEMGEQRAYQDMLEARLKNELPISLQHRAGELAAELTKAAFEGSHGKQNRN